MYWKQWIMGWVIGTVLLSGTAWAEDRVVVIEISGAINPVVGEFVSTRIAEANADKIGRASCRERV